MDLFTLEPMIALVAGLAVLAGPRWIGYPVGAYLVAAGLVGLAG